jgi:RND family efflux transporter MFP subunit
MSRLGVRSTLGAFVIVNAVLSTACGSGAGTSTQAAEAPAPPVAVSPVAAVEEPVARFIRVTGSLMADEHADVAAELAGRVIATPVERGSPVAEGRELVRVSPVEAEAQVQEAEANAAQIEARLGLKRDDPFDADRVPEVQNAVATLALAESEFARVQSLLDQRVVSQSEFDTRRTQLEVAKRQVDVAKNGAAQQFQALQAARARVALARKALADTVVRAPFAGVVAERLVSVGDYVTKGAKVAVVVRVDPLRVELTVPTPFIAAIGVGQSVDFEVDAYPGRTFRGQVRYVSPALEASQRALTVEAIVANPKFVLKPGLFATARIEQSAKTPGVLVPSAAVQTTAGTSRVFVVVGDRVEERLVTIGQTLDGRVEVTKGLKGGEHVATANIGLLVDGRKVTGN